MERKTNGITSALPNTKLLLLCRKLRSLRDLFNTETGYFGGNIKEEVYTSLIAFWFQRFFGVDEILGIDSLHQLPCGSSTSPDLHIVTI